MMAGGKSIRLAFTAWLPLVLLACPFALLADEFRPALLEINEREGGWVDVTWKVPMRGDQVLAITPILPESLVPLGPGSGRRVPGAWIESSSYRSGGQALNGSTLRIEGLSAVPTDVLVRITLQDGGEHSAILRSGSNSFTIPELATRLDLAISYWRMGTIHILEGYDHLMFVLALMLLVSNYWVLLKTITAFTIAHSISLALATLGVVNMPGPPTEAVIALSIVFLAVEIVHSREGRVTHTDSYPWLVALAFGLVHGLGFAGALAEVGLPQQDIPLALLMFNLGVETGQLMFVGVVLLIIAIIKHIPSDWLHKSGRLVPYAIGSVAAFWTIQRVGSFLTPSLP
jgi:hydrogenase/urease accessory protein HupE